MSEKKKLDEEYEYKLRELQNNCYHKNTKPYSCHAYDSDYCLRCGAIINIKYKKRITSVNDSSKGKILKTTFTKKELLKKRKTNKFRG